MRGRLLFFTIMLVFIVTALGVGVVSSLIEDDGDLSTVTLGSGLVVCAFGLLLSELGRHRGGHIPSVWVVVIIVASAAALVVACLQVILDYRDVRKVVISIVAAAVVITNSIYVVSGNRRGRLGMDRQPRSDSQPPSDRHSK
ncbi:hypothetical protein [Microlunatus soli]|uniref:Uncharacterized protein n=1 Tax=Microlunatus soli TaxID=630515 RepID=A0A1H2A239_9ACTN|nr:hypothetical protein [Microlunatus soli]SDT39953.1 hypothetical protein SAMN04489812_5609 [Microlunatus soli]